MHALDATSPSSPRYVTDEHADLASPKVHLSVGYAPKGAPRGGTAWAAAGVDANGRPQLTRRRGGREASLAMSGARIEPAVLARLVAAADACLLLDDPVVPPAGPLAGDYTVTSTVIDDGCRGGIIMVARGFSIDPTERWVRWQVGEGAEPIVARDADGFLARGDFASWAAPDACRGSRVGDVWRVRRAPDGALVGTDDSTWFLKPDCARSCTVRFSVRATRR